MKFLLTHIEELLPIAIFVIVMIYSAVGRKKTPAPAPERDEDDSGYQYDTENVPQSKHTQQVENYSSPVDDELRRTLDDIFKAKKPQPQTQAKTHQSDDNEWHKTVAAGKIKDAKKAAVKAEAKAAQRAIDRAPTPVSDALIYATQTLEPIEAPQSEYASAEQARVGMIWSEILQRPVALR